MIEKNQNIIYISILFIFFIFFFIIYQYYLDSENKFKNIILNNKYHYTNYISSLYSSPIITTNNLSSISSLLSDKNNFNYESNFEKQSKYINKLEEYNKLLLHYNDFFSIKSIIKKKNSYITNPSNQYVYSISSLPNNDTYDIIQKYDCNLIKSNINFLSDKINWFPYNTYDSNDFSLMKPRELFNPNSIYYHKNITVELSNGFFYPYENLINEKINYPHQRWIRRQTPSILFSFPGSGNTWSRQLIEYATGIYTGSIYSDWQLTESLPGESTCNWKVSTLTAHPSDGIRLSYSHGFVMSLDSRCLLGEGSGRGLKTRGYFDIKHDKVFPFESNIETIEGGGIGHASKIIMLNRNPYDAIWSEYQRRTTLNHVGTVKKKDFNYTNFQMNAGSLAHEYNIMWDTIFNHAVLHYNSNDFDCIESGGENSLLNQDKIVIDKKISDENSSNKGHNSMSNIIYHNATQESYIKKIIDPTKRLLVIRYEDITNKNKIESVLLKVVRFLDIPPTTFLSDSQLKVRVKCAAQLTNRTEMKREKKDEEKKNKIKKLPTKMAIDALPDDFILSKDDIFTLTVICRVWKTLDKASLRHGYLPYGGVKPDQCKDYKPYPNVKLSGIGGIIGQVKDLRSEYPD